jgi:hypothetical protein
MNDLQHNTKQIHFFSSQWDKFYILIYKIINQWFTTQKIQKYYIKLSPQPKNSKLIAQKMDNKTW